MVSNSGQQEEKGEGKRMDDDGKDGHRSEALWSERR